MDKAAQYLISKDSNSLQISYEDYMVLMEKAEEARRIRSVRDEVLTALEAFLDGRSEPVVETKQNEDNAPTNNSSLVSTVSCLKRCMSFALVFDFVDCLV